MAIALVTQAAAASSDGNGATTSGVNTTGATLIVINLASFTGAAIPNPSDSKGNTWQHLTMRQVGGDATVQMHYCLNPTVGSSHTFSVSGSGCYPSIQVQAFSQVLGFDRQNGNTTSSLVTTLQTGSVTPVTNNCVVVAGVAQSGSSTTIGSSFTALGSNYGPGTNFGGAIAYKVQTAQAAVNPAWSWTTASKAAAAIAVFTPVIPVITSNGGGDTASVSVAENSTAVTTVTTGSFTGTRVFSIGGNDPGVDDSLFQINSSTGVLTFVSAPDFENPVDDDTDNIYEVQVVATDDNGSDEQRISVTVTDVVESLPGAAHFVVARRKYNEEQS